MIQTIRAPRVGVWLGAAMLVLAFATAPHAMGQDDDLIARGQETFEESAGGVGCAYCHGLDARGQGEAGYDAKDIVGAEEAAVRDALGGGVPDMSFISLSDDEVEAVVAYLQHLAAPAEDEGGADDEEAEPAAQDASDGDLQAAPAGQAGAYRTINVSVTEDGFDPATITLQVGEPVQLVLRNRTQIEHHYKAPELPATDLLWLAPPDDFRAEGVSDDEHAMHHETDYVNWRAPSMAGIQPTGDQVHLWAYTRAANGGKDVLRFTPTEAGTYDVVCPLHPEFTGEIHVE